jgi:hypothetical protein
MARAGAQAAPEIQEHLAGVEDYILAEAVWREANHWPEPGMVNSGQ